MKGIGKGITTGDGGAVATGFKEGAKHMGSGIRQTTKAVRSGVGSGVGSVFKGSVTGVKSSYERASTKSKTSSKKHSKKHADDLAKLREEFKDQDYS